MQVATEHVNICSRWIIFGSKMIFAPCNPNPRNMIDLKLYLKVPLQAEECLLFSKARESLDENITVK